MRVFIYVQGLIGSGHQVRSSEIARELARHHQVWLLDGGRPIPRQALGPNVHLVQPPRIKRNGPDLMPLNNHQSIEKVMADRMQFLLEQVAAAKPDIMIVEHFPISKWLLHDEVTALINKVRQTNGTRVVCSLRDILPRHRYDVNPAQHKRRTRGAMEQYFDHLLIHADPRFIAQLETAPWAEGLTTPMNYTGFVSQKLPPTSSAAGIRRADEPGEVVVSVGGAGDATLAFASIAAWQRVTEQGADGGRTMRVFLPLASSDEQVTQLQQAGEGCRVKLRPFSVDFLNYLSQADLSISHGGYNTCMNLLESRVRALLAPIHVVYDQQPRVERMHELGLAQPLDEASLQADVLAEHIGNMLEQPRPEHHFDLNGAERTRELLEALLQPT